MCRSLLALVVFSTLVVSACGKNNEPPPPSSGVPGAKPESGPKNGGTGPTVAAGGEKSGDERARAMFDQLCATCHGPTGEGNGPVAANLPVKPRNYTDPAWQASVTDDQIRQIILKGGQAMGKSPMMPANPDLASDTPKLEGLLKIVRSFKK